MNITIQCFGQLARAAGGADHELELPEGATAQEALRSFAAAAPEEARALLFTSEGELQPTILLFLDEEPFLFSQPMAVNDRASIFIATPIAGGSTPG